MNPSSNRRRWSNFIVDWRSLSRLSIPFFIMAVVSVSVVALVRWRVMTTLEGTELMGAENLAAMNHLLDMQRSVTRLASAGIAVLIGICLALWVVLSHRIFGPMVSVQRHIRKLIDGDYSSRIAPRATDEFKDLISDLNSLAEKLESTTQRSSR